MPRQKKPELNINPYRERFSSFVVDLRRESQAAERSLQKEERQVAKQVRQELRQAAAVIKSIRPDLSALEKRSAGRLKAWLSRTGDKASHLFSRPPRIALARKKIVSPWQAFLSAREREFQQAFRSGQAGRYKAPSLSRPAPWYRPLLSFIVVLVLIIMPFKLLAHFGVGNFASWEKGIRQHSEAAVASLMAAAEAVAKQDFRQADTNFQAAGQGFLAAQAELGRINDGLLSLAGFSSNPKIKMAAESKKFLAAGATAASLGRNLVLATDSLFDNSQTDFSVRLDGFLDNGAAAVTDARALQKTVSGINAANLPPAYRSQFIALQEQIGSLADSLGEFVAAGSQLKNLLGLSQDKRYLVVFQNNAELRASGGFLGSYALVDVRDGQIKNLEVPAGGSYDTEAGRRVSVVAPEPLWLVDPLWHFWDANWWPDWPTTARNLEWFYEKSGGPTVDGVIGVTPSVVESLLQITGPIDMTAEYGVVVDADNFWQTVETVVERDNLALTHPETVAALPAATTTPQISALPIKQGLDENIANKPKKIIGDLLARIMEVLPQKLDRDNLLKIISVFEDNMSAKQILLYFNDPGLEAEAIKRHWGGEVAPARNDYLMVVNTNIAGQKSDRLMQESIQHESVIGADGIITDTVTITRTHTGLKNEPLTGVRNVDWLRVYVPAGSELIAADGFRRPDPEYLQDRPEDGWQNSPLLAKEQQARVHPSGVKIYEESDKTVFADWLMVDPGETATVTLRYRLKANFLTSPVSRGWREKINSWLNPDERGLKPYSLLVQKQPGAAASDFSSRLTLPTGWEIFWRHPEDLAGQRGWETSSSLTSDKYWTVLLKNNR